MNINKQPDYEEIRSGLVRAISRFGVEEVRLIVNLSALDANEVPTRYEHGQG